ncbi:MAG: hypothetical protein WDZ30_04075 [Cellvibrionaceae bacterium]
MKKVNRNTASSSIQAQVAGTMSRLLLALTICLVGLGGCAIQTVPDSDSDATATPPVARPQPPAPVPAVHALSRMLEECRAQVEAQQWQAAIASAERGLRIDRREPELYLLLAKSYWGLADLDRARQFARQGLRYVSGPFSPVAADLNRLLAVIE